jgi:hypothetical protein
MRRQIVADDAADIGRFGFCAFTIPILKQFSWYLILMKNGRCRGAVSSPAALIARYCNSLHCLVSTKFIRRLSDADYTSPLPLTSRIAAVIHGSRSYPAIPPK